MWEMVYGHERERELKRLKSIRFTMLNWAIVRNRLDGYAIQIQAEDRDLVIELLGDPIREAEDTR